MARKARMTLTAENLEAPAPPSDGDLLARYADQGDQQAFRELVGRHIDWLYATATRLVGNKTLAEDVTQGVLLALSRKAGALKNRGCLTGWLFEATRYGARTLLRAEARRREREKMLVTTAAVSEAPPAWDDLQGRIDSAIAHLPAPDCQILLLRFYQRMSHVDAACSLGISEEAARKRVTRALRRLRHALGTSASATALGSTLEMIPRVAAPAHLLPHVLAGTVSAKAFLIAKGVSIMVFASKLKVALAVCALTLLSGYLVRNYVFAQAGPPVQPVSGGTGGGGSSPNPGAFPGIVGGGGGGGGGWGGGGGFAGGGMSGSSGTRADGSTFRTVFDGTNNFTFTTRGNATTLVVKNSSGNVLFDGPYTTDDDKAKVPADLAAEITRFTAVSLSFRNNAAASVSHYADGTLDVAITRSGGKISLVVKDPAGKVLFDGPYNTDAEKAKVPSDIAGKVAGLAALIPNGAVGQGGAGSGAATNKAGDLP